MPCGDSSALSGTSSGKSPADEAPVAGMHVGDTTFTPAESIRCKQRRRLLLMLAAPSRSSPPDVLTWPEWGSGGSPDRGIGSRAMTNSPTPQTETPEAREARFERDALP